MSKSVFTEKYNPMVYFVYTTIHIYSRDVILVGDGADKKKDIDNFLDVNHEVVDRVKAEAVSMFGYELSDRQMTLGISYYLDGKYAPQSTKNTKPFTFD